MKLIKIYLLQLKNFLSVESWFGNLCYTNRTIKLVRSYLLHGDSTKWNRFIQWWQIELEKCCINFISNIEKCSRPIPSKRNSSERTSTYNMDGKNNKMRKYLHFGGKSFYYKNIFFFSFLPELLNGFTSLRRKNKKI